MIDGDMADWRYEKFRSIKESEYRVEDDSDLDRPVLIAESKGGASGYVREQSLDLLKTPWLHFLWRVEAADYLPNEGEKEGDDYAWRIYLIDEGIISARILNLVYAQKKADGEIWTSPYSTSLYRVRTYAVNPEEDFGGWQRTSLNVEAIWRQAFGDVPEQVDGMGIMTDSDTTNTYAKVRYGAIILSSSSASPFQER